MKLYCENCMGENEIDETVIKNQGYCSECTTCGQMIYVSAEEVEAFLLRKKPVLDFIPIRDKQKNLETAFASVDQSNTSTTVVAKIELPKKDTSFALISVIEGPDVGLEYEMQNPRLMMGRRGADINLNDRLVSRRHLVIEASGGRYLLKDLGSTNGTFLNGSPVSMEFLKHGDHIQIGSTLIRFRIKNIDTDVVVFDR
jgi:hypothetical protein